MIERVAIEVTGLVQGVGFRPFVYSLARSLDLQGFVQNRGAHVYVDAEGDPAALTSFITRLHTSAPRGASVDDLEPIRLRPAGHRGFVIAPSDAGHDTAVRMPPDFATCDECLRELFDPDNRRYRHPFITCTACGPRFSVIARLPYDRANTTMAAFEMCGRCRAEFEAPCDRRFHAQSTACHDCGPSLSAYDRLQFLAKGEAALGRALTVIAGGGIVAIKGIGGFHLACDATSEQAVDELRRRKRRDARPLAVMLPSVYASLLAPMHRTALMALTSPARPIVLVDRLAVDLPNEWSLAANVASGSPSIGLFLPYTPIHHLLLHDIGRPLVVTSGNRSQEPMACDDEEACQQLIDIADLFLTHDRSIARRCDDAVVSVQADGVAPIRRGRGQAPAPVRLAEEAPATILAVGGHLKSACCVAKGRSAYLSPHIGDLESVSACDSFARTVAGYRRLLDIEPQIVAHDLHPDYFSTRFAVAQSAEHHVAVQHHHAHVLSCAAEHRLTDPVIGVAFDGAGLGDDGAVWGGEFLVVDGTSCHRQAHLKYVPQPGGDAAAREPWRMAVAHLAAAGRLPDSIAERLAAGVTAARLNVALQMVAKGVCSPPTSSMGRLFDAVAAIMGLRDEAAFEGQAAMELERVAAEHAPQPYRFDLETGGTVWAIDAAPVVGAIAEGVLAGGAHAEIAANFHDAVGLMVTDVVRRIGQRTGIRQVVLTGGVFQNTRLSRDAARRLTLAGLDVYQHRQVPCNDGGLALGQALQAVRLARAGRLAEGRYACV